MSTTNKKSNVVVKKPMKKSATKPQPVVAKKATPKKNLTSKDVRNISSSQIIYSNSSKNVPKRTEFVGYSCIRRYYKVIEYATGKEKLVRMWIVIGDGHKRYRKFETQAEAINYFRNIKKYAFMRIQSVHSTKFTKTIYTFLELQWRGINVQELSKDVNSKEVIYLDDKDYEDQFSQYDEVDNEEYESFDYSSIDAVIIENEGAVYDTEEIALSSEAKVEIEPNVIEKKVITTEAPKEEVSTIIEIEEPEVKEEPIVEELVVSIKDDTIEEELEYKLIAEENEKINTLDKEEVVFNRDEETNNLVNKEEEEIIFFREKPMDILEVKLEEQKKSSDEKIVVEEIVDEVVVGKTVVYVEELEMSRINDIKEIENITSTCSINKHIENNCAVSSNSLCYKEIQQSACCSGYNCAPNSIVEKEKCNEAQSTKIDDSNSSYWVLEDRDDEFFENVKISTRSKSSNLFYWLILIIIILAFLAIVGLSIWLAL